MNTEKIRLKFIIPAILLILPVVLILLFDQAAWKSRYDLISEILGTIFFVDLPIGMCLWHWFKPEHFREWRWMIPFGLMTLGSWAVMAGGMWLACKTGHGPDNGFAAVCAYLFGWAYIWLTMIPIGAIYVFFRAILKLIPICREWKMSDTARKTIRNILLALIPCGILLCVGILSSFKLNTCARIVFSVLYPLAGIVMLILFTGTYIFRKPWRKLKKVFAFLLAVCLWLPYMVLPPAVWILVDIFSSELKLGDIFFIEKSPDPKIEAAYFNDGEFGNNCYAVHISSFDFSKVADSPVFHTKASVFKKVKVRWDGSRHFIFESSDVGVIHFRYQNGKWTATPENLLNKEKMQITTPKKGRKI